MNTQPTKKHSSLPNLSFQKSLKEIGRNAYVDWIVILILSSIVALVLMSGGVYLYTAVVKGDLQSKDHPVASGTKPFDREDLFLITSIFSAKENESAQAKGGYVGIADPSL